MTHRERLERKLELRREWSEGRQAKAEGLLARNAPFQGDWAFATQPGHIPERARVIARTDRAIEHINMAKHHDGAAAGIENQLERSTFSDDPDAVEQLEAKIAAAEAVQEHRKAVNAIVRKAPKNQVTDAKVAALVALGLREVLARDAFKPDFCGRVGIPSYALQNNSANIRRMRDRIAVIKVRQARTAAAEAARGGVVVKVTGTWAVVTFEAKPAREVLDALRGAEFRWSGGSWHGYAEKLPAEVRELSAEAQKEVRA